MQYGLRISYEKRPIQNVSIRYKYLGLTKVKTITRWFNQNKELKPITIAQMYPGEIQNVDQIELVDGTNGLSKTISSRQEIKAIVNDIKNIKLIPDTNQEGRTGYKFRIKLYENNNITLDIIPNQIKEIYYENNEELSQKLKQLYKEKFGSEY